MEWGVFLFGRSACEENVCSTSKGFSNVYLRQAVDCKLRHQGDESQRNASGNERIGGMK
jgi:hypothetical protein